MRTPEFEKELTQLINRCSMERHSDTPDFILALAEFLQQCLRAYNVALKQRATWSGMPPTEQVGARLQAAGPVAPDPYLDAPSMDRPTFLRLLATLIEKKDTATLLRVCPEDLRMIAAMLEKRDGP